MAPCTLWIQTFESIRKLTDTIGLNLSMYDSSGQPAQPLVGINRESSFGELAVGDAIDALA